MSGKAQFGFELVFYEPVQSDVSAYLVGYIPPLLSTPDHMHTPLALPLLLTPGHMSHTFSIANTTNPLVIIMSHTFSIAIISHTFSIVVLSFCKVKLNSDF